MKRLLLLLLFVAAVLGASAQQVETAEVYLRDGRIVRGRIVERLRGGMIRVQTVEGQSFTFMPAQVLNVIDIRRFSPFMQAPYWSGYVDAGYTTPNQYDVQLTSGLRLRNFLFIGAGMGYIAQPDAAANAVPVYAAGRFILPLITGLKPYVDARVGYAIPVNGTDVSGGAFLGLTTGAEINRWMFGLGYQGVWMSRNQHNEFSSSASDMETKGFTVRVGYRF